MELVGQDKIRWGSDYPHAEGLAAPVSVVKDLPGVSKDEIQGIMRDNGIALAERRPA